MANYNKSFDRGFEQTNDTAADGVRDPKAPRL